MKKQYALSLATIVFTCFHFSLNAQEQAPGSEFAPIGATWYYETIETMKDDYGYVKLTVEKDTLVEGLPARKISVTHTFGSTEKWDDLFVYQNGDSVFYYLKNRFRLVFNFGWEVGDTVTLYRSPFCLGYNHESNPFSAKAIITDKTTENVNGYSLRRWSVTHVGDFYDAPPRSSSLSSPRRKPYGSFWFPGWLFKYKQ